MAAVTRPRASASLPVILRYLPGGKIAFGNVIVDGHQFGGFAIVVAGFQGLAVGEHHDCLLAELFADPLQRRRQGPFVEPEDEAEREEILAAIGVAHAELCAATASRFSGSAGWR